MHMPLGARAYALARTKIAEFTQEIDLLETVAKPPTTSKALTGSRRVSV